MVPRKKSWIKPNQIKFKGHSYKNYIKEDFQENLVDLNWNDYFEYIDPNVLWECLRDAILSVINPMCPLKTFNVPEAKEPWITNEALEAFRDNDKLMKKAKRTKASEHWDQVERVRNSVGKK